MLQIRKRGLGVPGKAKAGTYFKQGDQRKTLYESYIRERLQGSEDINQLCRHLEVQYLGGGSSQCKGSGAVCWTCVIKIMIIIKPVQLGQSK